jgi:hypothetical protein
VNAESKTIHPIDFGQMEQLMKSGTFLGSDERLNLALFLWGVEKKNPDEVIDRALAFSGKDSQIDRDQRSRIRQQLRRAFESDAAPDKKFLEVFKIFSKEELPISSRLMAGTLKGLVTLQSEGYVTPDEFKEMVRVHATRLIKSKVPRLLLEPGFARNQCTNFLEELARRLNNR